jgi:hypothetical protein
MGPQGPQGPPAKYAGVAVVAKSGGDYTDPVQAMVHSDQWCGTPSATNPCLLRIMPGNYTTTTTIPMKSYVDIEGSGENVTKLEGNFSFFSAYNGLVTGASNAEIRFLTVENTGGEWGYSIAICNYSASPGITNATAIASGGSDNYGVHNISNSSPAMTNVTATASGGNYSFGVRNYISSPKMTNVTATASGGTNGTDGVRNEFSSPTMTNVTATASGGGNTAGVHNVSASSPKMTYVTAIASGGNVNRGVYNESSSVTMTNLIVTASGATISNWGVFNDNVGNVMRTITIDHSVITASDHTIYNEQAFLTTLVGNTKLDGGAAENIPPAILKCSGVYNEDYTFFPNSCP